MKKKRASKTKPKHQSTPLTLIMPPRDYQPSKAEHEAEVEMPEANMKTVREVFFRPIKVKVVKKQTKLH